jgi:CheY-like chemotaxis protein
MSSRIVLVVNDDPAAIEHCCPILEQNGYQVLKARNTQQALGVWSGNSEAIDFALVDGVMPGMKGLELVAEKPSKSVASSTAGDSDPVNTLAANVGANYLIFRRPFDLTIFLQMTSNLHGKAA